MKKILIVLGLLVLLLVACGGDNIQGEIAEMKNESIGFTSGWECHIDICYFHDNVRNVSCWGTRLASGGVSCIPDWQLQLEE